MKLREENAVKMNGLLNFYIITLSEDILGPKVASTPYLPPEKPI